MHVEMHQN